MDLAQKSGEFNRAPTRAFSKYSGQTSRHGQGIPNAPGVAGHLSLGLHEHRTPSLSSLVSLGPVGGAILQALPFCFDAQARANDRASHEGDPRALETRTHQRFYGRT